MILLTVVSVRGDDDDNGHLSLVFSMSDITNAQCTIFTSLVNTFKIRV
jgi:hypothetical protein